MRFELIVTKSLRGFFNEVKILPFLSFSIDRQMEERLYATDGSVHGGYVDYILSIGWIVWDVILIWSVEKS